jgi:uncharacterized protein
MLVAMALAMVTLTSCRSGEADAAVAHPVLDGADLLSDTEEAQLDGRLRTFWQDSGTSLVVVTADSLDGKTIEQAATDTFSTLGVGDRQNHKGLLLLIAENDRKARIEVGCGLESVITNAVAARIMENAMIPHFRSGDYPGGIAAGTDELMDVVEVGGTGHPVSDTCRRIMGVDG